MINAGENKATRAGRYVLQPAGSRAFIPAPLPPDPPVDLAGPLRALLSEADYALRDMSKPIGVATYRLTEALPAEMQEALPSIEELKKELGYGG